MDEGKEDCQNCNHKVVFIEGRWWHLKAIRYKKDGTYTDVSNQCPKCKCKDPEGIMEEKECGSCGGSGIAGYEPNTQDEIICPDCKGTKKPKEVEKND